MKHLTYGSYHMATFAFRDSLFQQDRDLALIVDMIGAIVNTKASESGSPRQFSIASILQSSLIVINTVKNSEHRHAPERLMTLCPTSNNCCRPGSSQGFRNGFSKSDICRDWGRGHLGPGLEVPTAGAQHLERVRRSEACCSTASGSRGTCVRLAMAMARLKGAVLKL